MESNSSLLNVKSVENQKKSQEMFSRLKMLIPGGVNSPVRNFSSVPIHPMVGLSGKGCVLTDIDGNSYIDYCMSWGALLHGHAHPMIAKAVSLQLEQGWSFGLSTNQEYELAKIIIDSVPTIENIRFVTSGTEALMSAVRLARGYTKRGWIIKFDGNYHGHYDPLLVESGAGVQCNGYDLTQPFEKTLSLPYNNIEIFKEIIQLYQKNIAAVIVEPIAANMGVVPADKSFLSTLREETAKIGALLIFDEVVTGFRVSCKGAQGLFGIAPDIVCFGKIIGGGFPVAAFAGKEEFMKHISPLGHVYQGGTMAGHPVGMVSGIASLELAKSNHVYDNLEENTKFLMDPIKKIMEEKGLGSVNYVPGMFSLFFGPKNVRTFEDVQTVDTELFKQYFLYLWKQGIYIPPSPYEASFISSVHSKEALLYTRETMIDYLSRL